MYRVTLRFYEELNDFLPTAMRKRDFSYEFQGRRSVKDLIESMGVPHVEVDMIMVNGAPEGFDYIVGDGDRLSVYPVFERFDIAGVTRARAAPLREPRFVADVHLRKLARRLRLLGFDVDFSEGRDDPELADISRREGRVLLSRDRQLFMRRRVERGLVVRSTDPDEQLREVLDRLQIYSLCRPFTRCIQCNGPMRELVFGGAEFMFRRGDIPKGVLAWCREFFVCDGCSKIYWKGSHYEKLLSLVESVLGENGQ
ncbi:MAG TPA: twitching motility protein PilT [Spirochaetes bacterium]|nr:twitching motility protein PilT [Spirochaetota bacterium]